MGWRGSEVITRIEKKQRPPSLKLVVALFILFGTPAADLFPDITAGVETLVMARVWDFYKKIQGDPSRKTKKQIELLEDAIKRAEKRSQQHRV